MTLTEKTYKPRLIDEKIDKRLSIFGAVSIEGPKWCGKTWTGLHHAKSVAYLTEQSVRDLARIDPKYIFREPAERPQLIDEWQISPGIWDAVRHECDRSENPGNFILTGSTTLNITDSSQVFHSGTGRIDTQRMYPMSLFESGDSSGAVSLSALKNGDFDGRHLGKVELDRLAYYIIRGGWPENLKQAPADAGIIPASYLESVVTKDIHEHNDKKRNTAKMRMLIRSLARNETSTAGDNTLVKDIETYEQSSERLESRQTIADYLSALNDLYLISDQPSYGLNFRSSKRVGKAAKRHLVDPSLAAAALKLNIEKLMLDYNTFGLLFESLVERDLKIYLEHLGGELYHFRDSSSGTEVDAIMEFEDGTYAAAEIKLSEEGIESAKSSLLSFQDGVQKKPKFLCIIVGHLEAAYQDPDSGIYILPATSLKP